MNGNEAVEVYARHTSKGYACGSGCAIGGSLILTAAHVLHDDGGGIADDILIRPLGSSVLSAAVLAWIDFDLDVALLRAQDSDWSPFPPIRWGTFATSLTRQHCVSVGFPDVQANTESRDVEQASGIVNPLRMVKQDLLAMSVDDPPVRVDRSKSPWAGMSGAAIWCDSLLIGVIIRDPSGFDSHRLIACPAAKFGANADFVAAVAEECGEPPLLEAVELQRLFAQPQMVHGFGGLLRADAQTVRFRGREEQLHHLAEWCEDSSAMSVRLLAGPGGSGKTRLAIRLTEVMARKGWAAGLLRLDAPTRAVEALNAVRVPMLLVFDYAETRIDQIERIFAELPSPPRAPIRVLLLARSHGVWLTQILPSRISLFIDTPVIQLSSLGEAEKALAWPDVVADIATGLDSLLANRGVEWTSAGKELAKRPALAPAGDGSFLGLLEAALAALLQAGQPLDQQKGAAPRDVLLHHEQKYWLDAARSNQLDGMHPTTLRNAAVSATVWGAANEQEAYAVVHSVFGLADLSQDRKRAVVGWLAALYPADGQYWGGLQPDRLAEHLCAVTLDPAKLLFDPSPTLLEEHAKVASPMQFDHALTLLARASSDYPLMTDVISTLISLNPGVAGPAAIKMSNAAENPRTVTDAIDSLIARDDLDFATLAALGDAFPTPTGSHASRAILVAEKVLALCRMAATNGETDPAAATMQEVWALNNLANRLIDADQSDAAIRTAREAIDIVGHLDRPGVGALGLLGASLATYAIALSNSNQNDLALQALDKAVNIYRKLVEHDKQSFAAMYGLVLRKLSDLRRQNHDLTGALQAGQEAISIYQELVSGDRAKYQPILAESLGTMTATFGRSERWHDALPVVEEAVHLFRDMASERIDDAHDLESAAGLAKALYYRANVLGGLGRAHEAVLSAQESVDLHRELASTGTDEYESGLGHALTTLAGRLKEAEHFDAAIAAAQESARIGRQLTSKDRFAHREDLVLFLTNYAAILTASGQPDKALDPAREAAEFAEELFARDNALYMHMRADSLTNLGRIQSVLGKSRHARRNLTTAANLGHAPAMGQLALLPDGVSKADADRWLRKAADLGDVDALHNLGVRHYEQNQLILAHSYFKKAADKGHVGSVINLGVIALDKSQFLKAEEYFCTATASGDAAALYGIGVSLYRRGHKAEAEKWYLRAAAGGDHFAMNTLGTMRHQSGEYAEAGKWYQQALANGNPFAAHNLASLKKREVRSRLAISESGESVSGFQSSS
jgi:tetratricopeptide (TPR) repeat protein